MDNYDDYLDKDLSIFKRQVNEKIKRWISHIDSASVDTILGQLELHTEGPLLVRGDRLFRRLRGDYTATDFIQTADNEDTAHSRRDQLCVTFIQSEIMPTDLRDEFVATYIEDMTQSEISEAEGGQGIMSSSPRGQDLDDMSLTSTVETLPILTTSQALTATSYGRSDMIQRNTAARTSTTAPLQGPYDFPPHTTWFGASLASSVQHNTDTQISTSPIGTHNPTSIFTTTSNSLLTTSVFQVASAISSNTGTTPRSTIPTSAAQYSSHNAYLNIGSEKLVWLRLPSGVPQQMPEPTAIELKRALVAERDLTFALDAAKQENTFLKQAHEEVLTLRQEMAQKNAQIRELTSIADDLRVQMKKLVSSAHTQVTEAVTRAKATKSVRIQDTYELIDPSHNDMEDLSLIRVPTQNIQEPLFSSTTRPSITTASQVAPQIPAVSHTQSSVSTMPYRSATIATPIPMVPPTSRVQNTTAESFGLPSIPVTTSNPVFAA